MFCRIIIWSNFIIYKATKCSAVWGWGQSIFEATSNKAASITAAPVSIVERKTSWPGQSQKETCLKSCKASVQPSFVHFGESSFSLENDL